MSQGDESLREREITKLTDLWYKIVGQDHHKDSDCHWYINKVWSYGDKPKYRVEHYGFRNEGETYLLQDFDIYSEAERCLVLNIKTAIEKQIKFAKEKITHTEEWDKIDIKIARKILELTEGYEQKDRQIKIRLRRDRRKVGEQI